MSADTARALIRIVIRFPFMSYLLAGTIPG